LIYTKDIFRYPDRSNKQLSSSD